MGYKSVVVNVSDLSSMGADNIGFLLNLAVPKDTLLDDFDDLICGVIKACDDHDIPLIGGDTNQSNEIILSGTALGQVDKDKVLMKYGFKPGDLVCITGELGLAALGFELLKLKEMQRINLFEMVDVEEKLEKAYEIDSSLCELAIFKALKIEAKYNEGHILRDHNTEENRITATDITDGIASEFYEILYSDKKYCKSINQDNDVNSYEDMNDSISYAKGIRIYEDKLPIEDEFKEIASVLGLDYLDLFLHIGEDFELLFTINEELKDQLTDELNFYVIGEITEKNTVEIVLSNGDIKQISSKGYQHLK
jgi:thiamine-monophosphate kinase